MSKIKNGGLDQYGAETFEQQQLGTAGVERVNNNNKIIKDAASRDIFFGKVANFQRMQDEYLGG